MLVSAKQNLVMPLPKRPGEDATAEAAAGLQSVITQALQNSVQAQDPQITTQVQESATGQTTQQVSEATKISDNVDEAFAKTRVNLQAVYAPLPEGVAEAVNGVGSATSEFKEYMSKTPEQRIHDAILEEMGLTQEKVDEMPPERQKAIGEEVARRMQEKAEIVEQEKEQKGGDQNKSQVVDKFLAAL
ncbi:hypothetical protein M1M11_17930 [Pseudomonas azerbaijanoccidens]|uniref:hypothetical protein n=1 Tax=Pseudomonas azerbaijanoccidentalis TaxID=2842347 RepID=UPI002009DD68|nr:hypothetical protein [Pseudomonas azerbaijanoccidentalis]MCK8666767.1 hypothetical protein [Pseudomonas azerbaijanoccidentalis]